MLPLESSRWGELTQAYGTAEDVPRLLAHLDRVGDAQRRELWFALWSMLCKLGEVHDASYAAVPHLVAFAARQPAPERARALHLVGAIEIGRLAPGAPVLPDGLSAPYHAALGEVPAVIAGCIGAPWDGDTTQILAGVLAVAKGHPRFGSAALHLEARVACPICEASHPPAGWDIDADD